MPKSTPQEPKKPAKPAKSTKSARPEPTPDSPAETPDKEGTPPTAGTETPAETGPKPARKRAPAKPAATATQTGGISRKAPAKKPAQTPSLAAATKKPSAPRKRAPKAAAAPTAKPNPLATQPGFSLSDAHLFDLRLERSLADLMDPLNRLYAGHPDFEGFRDKLLTLLRTRWSERPLALKDLDIRRDLEPDWFLSEKMVGYVFYVDRFAKTLKDVTRHIDYLKSLGVTYVHFMPCLKPRPGDNDGGYSVMDYLAINPDLGTMDDFEAVTAALRAEGISVCIDLVLNHTAKEHEWAEKARQGNAAYQDYYWMFDTKEMPDAFEKTLVEIFPANAPGNFTYYKDIRKYVWTTFNEHQWDLNWTNPAIFLEIVDIMLTLANRGAEILRLDAVAFMWKRLGTDCQNLPEVHDILQALRAATRIAAPALIHKAEAIVSPRNLVPYLGVGAHAGREANLAYHNNLMVQYWSALASADTKLMTHTLAAHFPEKFRNASWGTYIRCHDDIGWAITDEDADTIPGITAYGHRQFLADFYAGLFPGSFARGAVFQENPITHDRRNSGSFASLAGLEKALEAKDQTEIDFAISRILMGNALIASFGGLPLLYMGDEIGLLNDKSYLKVRQKAGDNRWMHRPKMDWTKARKAEDATTVAGRILAGVRHIMARRKTLPELSATVPTRVFGQANPALFAFARPAETRTVIGLFNFTHNWQSTPVETLYQQGLAGTFDLLTAAPANHSIGQIYLGPYQAVWLA